MALPLLIPEAISKLSDAVIYVARTTANFKPQLQQLKNTLDRITPILVEIQNQNLKLNRTSSEQAMFKDELEDANKVVCKCSTIKKWNFILKFTHSLKLEEVNQKLLRFFQIEVQAVQCRDIKETLAEVTTVNERITSLASDVEHLGQTLSGGSMAESSGGERKRSGWPVPLPPKFVVGFDNPLKELKIKVLSDDESVAGKVVVVSAAGGCGKTTLVKMLCNDQEIKGHFGENVFFATVSQTPNFMATVNDLINSHQVNFQGSEDAKNKLENFLLEKVSGGPVLLVLDDVWQESYVKNFEFEIERYKLLVTSRMIFPKYDNFKFDPLSDKDAKLLFLKFAKPIPSIGENLVDQMVECCKKHPLTLSVVASSLNGKDEVLWRCKLKSLSQGRSILDLNEEVLNLLERSVKDLENEFEQCYLDFGLFPEDQRIHASVLLDMWAHLYNHDDEGIDTLAKIFELSYRNLIDYTPKSFRWPRAMVNYCEDQDVTQHDLLRQLAINLNSKLPIEKRQRLFINEQNGVLMTNVQGGDRMTSIEQVQGPMQARILSISTGESSSLEWCNMRVPEVEVMLLHLRQHGTYTLPLSLKEMQKLMRLKNITDYTLPPFLKEMQKLKILNITNYAFHRSDFKDFHLLGCLSNLTTIRFERVTIPSLSRSTLALVNLQKVSFITCNMKNAFKELDIDNLNVWPSLVEIEMESCHNLVVYPRILCSSVHLRKLSIKLCFEMDEISEEFGTLTSLETLILRSCGQLKKLPESITGLQKLSIIEISRCFSLNKLPEHMGSLGGLRTIYMIYVSEVCELPPSVKDLSNTKVVCDESLAGLWKEFPNVEVNVVELWKKEY